MSFKFSSPRSRQPRASGAHPCTAPRARRRVPTVQLGSRTSFTLPLVLHQPMHTVRQRPAYTEQQLATAVHSIAARAGTGLRNCHPLCVQPSHSRSHNPRVSPHLLAQFLRARFAQLGGTPNRNERSACTRTASSWPHTLCRNTARESCSSSVVLSENLRKTGGSHAISY
jgi:hypothetical protein